MTKPPHWRSIEAALLSLFHDYGIEVDEDHGDRFVHLRQGDNPTVEYSVEEMARELEKRL